ncbi:MAG TPA: gamma-glutamyltransferase [Thermoanaerobaculia bacterium]|nr:gamma-glutamyltransferase [Thermoanaerobaculia bacterium]
MLILAPVLVAVFRGGDGLAAQGDAAPFGPARVLTSTRGMVVSAAPEASMAGAEVLAAGGNAMDAAIATALALAVVYPQAGNLAGGGFLVARSSDGTVQALDFRETAPARASRDMFLGPDGRPVPKASTATALAVATPGSVRGYAEAHRRLGRLAWEKVVAPAEKLAREGFLVPAGLSMDLVESRELLTQWEETRRLFFPAGKPLVAGSLLRQPDLAATLARIAKEGPEAFHRGDVAARLVSFVKAHGGVLSEEDLAGYTPVWRAPDEIRFGRLVVHTMPLPSSAGQVLRSVLAQLEVARGLSRGLDPDSYHLLLEAERRAYADRNRWLGDGDCAVVPLGMILAPARLAELGASIDPARATPSASVRATFSREAKEAEETTHLSVATPDGSAISLTTTLNGSFGNGAIVPGIGVLLNNEMDDFTMAPDVPNLYGLVQGRVNEVRPGARPLSSVSPVIVEEDGKPLLVVGSPGGSTIPTTVLQVLLRATGGESLGAAVAAPRLHHQHTPDVVFVEKGGASKALRESLRSRGHVLRDRGPIGQVHAIVFERDGQLTGVGDPRGHGAPAAP